MGQKLAAYNTSGAITAFYDTVDSPAPAGVTTIDITDTQWQTCLSNSGYTVVSGVLTPPSPPTPAQLAATAQAIQVSTLQVAYNAAVQANVSYTSKGNITETYQANPQSVQNLQNTILGFQAAGVVPTGFYWVAADNTQVPFTYADLQGLAAVMVASGWANFQTLQTKKAQIVTLVNLPPRAASTPYTTGTQIVDTNGNVWNCTTNGTTGTTCTFPATPAAGATKTDGGVTWTFVNSQVSLIQGVTF